MEKRSRLGRGLSGLLNVQESEPSTPPGIVGQPIGQSAGQAGQSAGQLPPTSPTPPSSTERELFHVELSRLVANPSQPRKHFDSFALAELAQSIKAAGVIQPVIVRPVGDRFEVIAGERRWRAAQLAGLRTIPVLVKAVDSATQAQIALIENIHRADLNPIERALAYRQIIQNAGLTHQELASQLGEERSSISNHLRLLELNDHVQKLLLDSSLSLGHAKLLAGVEDQAEQTRLANAVVAKHLSVRQLESLLAAKPIAEPPPSGKNAHLAYLERQLSRDLQMRAEVKQARKGGKGRLVIHYASLDQFDQILTRLGVKIDD